MFFFNKFKKSDKTPTPLPEFSQCSPSEASELILQGRAPKNLTVTGVLKFAYNTKLAKIPAGLRAKTLDLTGCTLLEEIPSDLKVNKLVLTGCSLWFLPSGLKCLMLEMRKTPLISVPEDLRVQWLLDLQDNSKLRHLPSTLEVGTLNLRNCSSLERLPDDLTVSYLDISGCSGITRWPAKFSIIAGRLAMRNCSQFETLPNIETTISQLDLRGCSGIKAVPEGINVTSWIDVAGTAITSLPKHLDGVEIRWKGVPVDTRIAFRPEDIRVEEVMEARNVELRRVLLERVGYERFIEQTHAETLDKDRDPGGERRLLKVPMKQDEDLVCLSVSCPSTARRYFLRVPPFTRTCKEAAAWIAGFDKASDYKPLKET